MHVFGGTASTGLVCSLYSIVRSVASAGLLYGLGYVAFYFMKVTKRGLLVPLLAVAGEEGCGCLE